MISNKAIFKKIVYVKNEGKEIPCFQLETHI